MQRKLICSFQKILLDWYRRNHRPLPWRKTSKPYDIWVSEVMLQQTQVKTVVPYYQRFRKRFPDLKTLAEAELEEVLKVWEGLGYYSRARNLHKAAQQCVAEFNGEIPDNLKMFQQLAGVGAYIGAAVQSIAFNRPHAVVDGNVKRVLARLIKNDAPVNQSSSHKIFQTEADRLLETNSPGLFNQAMMELGATICKPQTPNCALCPVRSFCAVFASGAQSEYPKRVKKRPIPTYHIAVGVIFKNDQILITRRKPEGLLGGLWEFPGGKVEENETAQHACIREIKEELNLDVEIASHVTQIKHAYTHFKINMDVFYCRYVSGRVRLNSAVAYRWIALNEIDRYPFPKANHKFIPLLQNI